MGILKKGSICSEAFEGLGCCAVRTPQSRYWPKDPAIGAFGSFLINITYLGFHRYSRRMSAL